MPRLRARLLRPEHFLLVASLDTGARLSLLAVGLHKASTLFGLLAPLTGAPLSGLAALFSVYSFASLVPLVLCLSGFLAERPLATLVVGQWYAVDSLMAALFMVAFAWYPPTIYTPHRAETATPDGPSEMPSTEPEDGPRSMLAPRSTSDLALVILAVTLFQLFRLHTLFVVLAHARQVVRRAAREAQWRRERLREDVRTSAERGGDNRQSEAAGVSLLADNGLPEEEPMTATHLMQGSSRQLDDPFASTLPPGRGWRGRLGRRLVSVQRNFWLGLEPGEPKSGTDLEGMDYPRRHRSRPWASREDAEAFVLADDDDEEEKARSREQSRRMQEFA